MLNSSVLLVLSMLAVGTFGQTCIGPCFSGVCPTGYTCYSSTAMCCTTTTTTCVDLLNPSTGVSDCPSRAYLCSNSVYYTLMTQQCPRTCGRCTSTSTCVNLASNCATNAYLCNNSLYYSLMTTQCPLTCGRCSG